MKNVGLNFLLIFFLIFTPSYRWYAGCPWWNIKSNTWWEEMFGGNWVKEIKVKAIKNQGVNGYFNPKIEVCAYDGESYCYKLHSGVSCQKIYGTQSSGAGVSAAVFVDWKGIKEGEKMKSGLSWEWAEGVTKEEREKFANFPKICACSQKIACADSATKLFAGASYVSMNECDTCYQTTVKCAPVPLAPGPPPFCKQLAMLHPQVRIVPIKDQDNDYFNPRVRVIIDELARDLYFQKALQTIEDGKGTTYYFETYRKKDQLCAEYLGTKRENSVRKLQFPARCFPSPSTPDIEIVKVVDENTLEVKIKTSKEFCRDYGYYDKGFCTLDIGVDHSTNIGPLSLKVVKPAIIKKTSIDQSNKFLEKILSHVPPFSILEQHGYIFSIIVECKSLDEQGQCRMDSLGRPEIEAKYEEKSKSKILCISGWQPEPEESVLKRESEIIPLRSMGTRYIEYNSVYSKESNQFYYHRIGKDATNLLKGLQEQLNSMLFDKQGYVFFPDKNRQEKGKCSYCIERDNEVRGAFESSIGLKVVYKLTDVEQYLKKEDDSLFSLKYEEVDCRNEKGEILMDEEGRIRKCIKLKDQLVKVNKTEVFYADKFCRLNLEDVVKKVSKVIKTRLTNKNLLRSYTFSDNYYYKDDSSIYGDVKMEVREGNEDIRVDGKIELNEGDLDYVNIRLTSADDEELKTIINALVENPDINDISDLIKKLHPNTAQRTTDGVKLIIKFYPGIINAIKEEIGKELLGDEL